MPIFYHSKPIKIIAYAYKMKTRTIFFGKTFTIGFYRFLALLLHYNSTLFEMIHLKSFENSFSIANKLWKFSLGHGLQWPNILKVGAFFFLKKDSFLPDIFRKNLSTILLFKSNKLFYMDNGHTGYSDDFECLNAFAAFQIPNGL